MFTQENLDSSSDWASYWSENFEKMTWSAFCCGSVWMRCTIFRLMYTRIKLKPSIWFYQMFIWSLYCSTLQAYRETIGIICMEIKNTWTFLSGTSNDPLIATTLFSENLWLACLQHLKLPLNWKSFHKSHSTADEVSTSPCSDSSFIHNSISISVII